MKFKKNSNYAVLSRRARKHYKKLKTNKNLRAVYRDAKSIFGPTISREIGRVKKARKTNNLFQEIDF